MSKFILAGFADDAGVELKTQMDVFDSLGLKNIEMRGVNGRPLVEHTIGEAKSLKTEMDERGFKVFSIGSPIGKYSINDDFAPHLDLFKHTLELAKTLGAGFIRLFSFYIPEGEDPNKYEGEVMSRWGQFVKAAEGYGIVLAHENQNTYGNVPDRCLKLIKEMNCSYVKHCFDPSAFAAGTEVYPYAYELLKEHIAYLHIKDSITGQGGCVPAGHGDKQIKEVLTALYAEGYEGYLSLEPHLMARDPASFLAQSAGSDDGKKSAEAFKVATDALKKILLEVTGIAY